MRNLHVAEFAYDKQQCTSSMTLLAGTRIAPSAPGPHPGRRAACWDCCCRPGRPQQSWPRCARAPAARRLPRAARRAVPACPQRARCPPLHPPTRQSGLTSNSQSGRAGSQDGFGLHGSSLSTHVCKHLRMELPGTPCSKRVISGLS